MLHVHGTFAYFVWHFLLNVYIRCYDLSARARIGVIAGGDRGTEAEEHLRFVEPDVRAVRQEYPLHPGALFFFVLLSALRVLCHVVRRLFYFLLATPFCLLCSTGYLELGTRIRTNYIHANRHTRPARVRMWRMFLRACRRVWQVARVWRRGGGAFDGTLKLTGRGVVWSTIRTQRARPNLGTSERVSREDQLTRWGSRGHCTAERFRARACVTSLSIKHLFSACIVVYIEASEGW